MKILSYVVIINLVYVCGTFASTLDCTQDTCGSWQSWEPCILLSGDCSKGAQFRKREGYSNVFDPENGAEARSCSTCGVPINCVWNSWGEWGQCSETCKPGKRERKRDVRIRAENGGSCLGLPVETEDCNGVCTLLAGTKCSAWSTCGLPEEEACGQRVRSRRCWKYYSPRNHEEICGTPVSCVKYFLVQSDKGVDKNAFSYTVSTARGMPRPSLNRGSTIRILIHGFKNDYSKMNPLAQRLYKEGNPVIVVDWSPLSKRIIDYDGPCKSTVPVGEDVAKFILELRKMGYSFANIHLIGFSLGGKVSAMTGALLDGKLKRISGLDTPLYCIDLTPEIFSAPKDPAEIQLNEEHAAQLQPGSAQFVDTIRTTELSGTKFQRQGHAEFFVRCRSNCACVRLEVYALLLRLCFKNPWACVLGIAANVGVELAELVTEHSDALDLFISSVSTPHCRIQGLPESCDCPELRLSCDRHQNELGFRASQPSQSKYITHRYMVDPSKLTKGCFKKKK